MSVVIVKGTLVASDGPCQSLFGEDGETYWVVGDLSKVALGDTVFASGTVLTQSVCGKGRTIVASFVGKKLPAAANPAETFVRDLDVEATFSPMDISPKFTLEGETRELKKKGSVWKGKYDGVSVTGKLQVVFVSNGAKGQKFVVKITATDPNAHTSKTESFSAIAEKGTATIDDEMVV